MESEKFIYAPRSNKKAVKKDPLNSFSWKNPVETEGLKDEFSFEVEV
jgi:hypothetical protein